MKKFTYLLVIGGLALALQPAWAQQDALYSQYMFNTLAINPGYAGSRDVVSVTGLFRRQWVGVNGAPSTATATIDLPLNNKRWGVGAQLFNDEIGISKNTGGFFSAAYRVRFSEKGTLALGLQAGFYNFRADYTRVNLTGTQPGQPGALPADPAFGQDVNAWLPNLGAGLYYSTDRFYLGLSAPTLIPNRLNDNNSLIQTDRAFQYRHLFLASGYVFRLGAFTALKPSALVKWVAGAPIQLDLNANVWLYDKIGLGASYRTGSLFRRRDAVVGMVEFQLSDAFRLGYAFDTPIGNLRAPTHEFMLRYEFGRGKTRVVSPRYF